MPTISRVTCRGFALLLLAGAVCALWPAAAEATCGDYLEMSAHGDRQTTRPQETGDPALPERISKAARNDASPASQPLPGCHCKGPSCSRGPASPPQPESRHRTTSDQSAWWCAIADAAAAPTGEPLAERAARLPEGFRRGILRPPR